MNFGVMQTLVYRYGFDASDPVAAVLNGAMHEIETIFDWPFLEEGPWQFVLPIGTSSPTLLPTDFFKVMSLKDLDHLTKLKYFRQSKFKRAIQNEQASGYPVIYTNIAGASFQVYPVPPAPVNMELVYQATAPDMSGPADVPNTGGVAWPLYMHFPIVWRSAAIMLQMENEEDRAKEAQAQYERAILSAMAKSSERELDEVETVEDEQGYGSVDYYTSFRRN
jgi:hypothetical protein